ncbi:MAG TPA: hypothetical protein VM580_31415 [Labilithrix sp.]|jgi:hypothetical protein|nr:hypothetical protein [Labilithrix sp.]
MATRAQDDAMMWGVAALLGILAVGLIVTSIVLFTKKKTLAGVLVLVAALLCGLMALGIAGLMILAMFAWH